MVGMQSHPPGVSGKSVTTLGVNSIQSPIGEAPFIRFEPQLFQDLISSIEARNRG